MTQDTTTALCAPTRLVMMPGQLVTVPEYVDCEHCLLMMLAAATELTVKVGRQLSKLATERAGS